MTNLAQKFPVLPNERLLRFPEVKKRVGISRSQVHLLISQGKFPPPIKLGARASAWLESSIDQWISERIIASQDNA